MKSAIRITMLLGVVATFAASGFAALSPKLTEFGSGPAQWLMTKAELAQWKTITTDADAQAFIDLFWARRDPTPETPANEFRDDFEARVAASDKAFTFRGTPGSMTDRGRTIVVLGKFVKRMQQPGGAPTAPAAGENTDESQGFGTTIGRTPAVEVWQYDGTKVKGLPPEPLELRFIDKTNVGEYRFDPSRKGTDVGELFEQVNEARITTPNPPMASQTQTTKTTVVHTTSQPVGPPPLATPALVAAIDALKGGTSTLPKNASVAYAELVSPDGEFFVPVGIYLPKSTGLGADAADTLFGSIEDESGKVVDSFEEPTTLFVSNGDLLADETVSLPTGKYTAILGLAKAGQPVALASKAFEVKEIASDAVGVSGIILTDNLDAELPKAAPQKAAFAFGQQKIVPKGNLVFSNQDNLAYFLEVHNPGIDPATNLPRLQSKMELSGGKLKNPMTAPLGDVPAAPLSGHVGPGQYLISGSIALGQIRTPLAPGDYLLKVKLIDTVSKQTYTAEQAFRIE